MERTLSIIKPNAVKNGVIGKILDHFESNGLRIVAMKKMLLSKKEAEMFYAEHKGKPFFDELVGFMTSDDIVALVLEGEKAVSKNRELMGSTNPKEAATGTIRALYADSITQNAVHGSDSVESANREIGFFFSGLEIK